jgi:hypothetical protein
MGKCFYLWLQIYESHDIQVGSRSKVQQTTQPKIKNGGTGISDLITSSISLQSSVTLDVG